MGARLGNLVVGAGLETVRPSMNACLAYREPLKKQLLSDQAEHRFAWIPSFEEHGVHFGRYWH